MVLCGLVVACFFIPDDNIAPFYWVCFVGSIAFIVWHMVSLLGECFVTQWAPSSPDALHHSGNNHLAAFSATTPCVCVHVCVHVCACMCVCMCISVCFLTLDNPCARAGGAYTWAESWRRQSDNSRAYTCGLLFFTLAFLVGVVVLTVRVRACVSNSICLACLSCSVKAIHVPTQKPYTHTHARAHARKHTYASVLFSGVYVHQFHGKVGM